MKLSRVLMEEISDDEFWNAGESIKKGTTEDKVDLDQLKKGIEVEKEHTTNEEIAKKIALDHLAEHPDYYTKLLAAGL